MRAHQRDSLGRFQAGFTMPMVAAGQHKFLAVELKPQKELWVLPPHILVTTAVLIYVQELHAGDGAKAECKSGLLPFDQYTIRASVGNLLKQIP